MVNGRSSSTIELKRPDRRALTIELKRRGRAVQPVSVCFGIAVTIRFGKEIQCLLFAGFLRLGLMIWQGKKLTK